MGYAQLSDLEYEKYFQAWSRYYTLRLEYEKRYFYDGVPSGRTERFLLAENSKFARIRCLDRVIVKDRYKWDKAKEDALRSISITDSVST